MRFRVNCLAAVAASMALAAPSLAHESGAPADVQSALPASAVEGAAKVDAFHAALDRGELEAALA